MNTHDSIAADARCFERAVAQFDAMNAADPNFEMAGSTRVPKELLYAQRMTDMLARYAPDASEAVRLAARCQHVRRWEIPRARYPATPEGYKAWRTHLLDFHAGVAVDVLRACGYDEAMVTRVASLLRKERLKRNSDAQLLEDVVGLVFVEHYLESFVAGHPAFDDGKLIDILRKTFRKMSPHGVEAASRIAGLSFHLATFVARAAAAAGRASALPAG